MNFPPVNFSIRLLAAVLCWLFLACNGGNKSGVEKGETDILALTDKMSVINRPNMLRYADSLYNAQKNKSPFMTAGHYMAYSNYYDLHILPLKALIYTDSAIAIIDRQNLDDSLWIRYYFAAHVKRAHTLFETGAYSQSIDAYFKIEEMAKRPANKCSIGVKLYNNIGLVLFKQQHYAEARRYFTRSLKILDECSAGTPQLNDNFKRQELLGNIGESFANENKLDSALRYYHKALRVIENGKLSADPKQDKVFNAVSKAVMVSNIARIFVKENKLDSAELYFKEDIRINALSYKNEIRNAQESELNLAGLYNTEKKYPQMKQVLGALRKNLDSIRNEDVELGWRKLKAAYDSETGLPAQALADYKSYVFFKDSLDRVRTLTNQSDINRELVAKEAQMNNVVLTEDNKLSHLYLTVALVFSVLVLLIVALIYSFYRRGKNNIKQLTLLNREINEQKDKLEFVVLELEKSNMDKARILRVVAHDLRDPIGGAATLVNTVVNEDLPKDYEKETLGMVERSLNNSINLINELAELELSPADIKLDKELADINETTKQCAALMQLIAERKHQKILFKPLPAPLSINMDAGRVARMINNLVGNAIKFSHPGGTIILKLEQKTDGILISVTDSGIGIPADMQADLFHMLSGARRTGTAGEKSFGLGLSICKQIVEAHHGKIWVESAPDEGTTFYVELPL